VTVSADPAPVDLAGRRPLATRSKRWAIALAHALGRAGVRPNAVSLASIAFAIAAGGAFYLAPAASGRSRPWLFLAAAACIQLRLLCNLLDGMLAVEEGLKSSLGDLYNELPDRAADVVILVGAGYAASWDAYGPLLGWAAAVLAVTTAYVRALGSSLGAGHQFVGPMAKPHRMFALTVASLAAAVEVPAGLPPRAMGIALIVIVAGAIATVGVRIRRIATNLRAR
jgi:phosphatidylglycerophosphate synthase